MDERAQQGTGQDPAEGPGGFTRGTFLKGAGGAAALAAVAPVLSACGGDDETSGTTGTATTTESSPKVGGTLRLGVGNGSEADLMDGQYLLDIVDGARLVTAFEPLAIYSADAQYEEDGLAESIEATKKDASEWVIRLRPEIEFHNGKTLSADDVVYSLNRIIDPKLELSGYGALSGSLSKQGIKKVDNLTVKLTLTQPNAVLPFRLAEYTNGIVPVGYERYPSPQIGTGPYKLKSFTPGKQSVHVRNENYWRDGGPYLDEVILIDLPDPTARVNALLSGQVDAITDIPFAQIPQAEGKFNILESQPTEPMVVVMDIRQKPFDDPKVRQAVKLLANRGQLLAQAMSGYGAVANDLFGNFDPAYADNGIAQREQDIEQAQSLLKEAGQENLTLELFTWEGQVGMTQAASILAEQAKEAGVTINVKDVDPTTFFSNNYGQSAFYTTYWGYHDYLYMVAASMLPDSQFNETGWPPKGSPWISLYNEALRTVPIDERNEVLHKMMAEDHELGGNLIPYFRSYVDAYDPKIQNLQPAVVQRFGGWDQGFRTIWFD